MSHIQFDAESMRANSYADHTFSPKQEGYKFTDAAGRCRELQMTPGVQQTVSGPLELCKNGFHLYAAPAIEPERAARVAALMDRRHGDYLSHPGARLWLVEAAGDFVADGTKAAYRSVTLLREVAVPTMTLAERVGIAREIALWSLRVAAAHALRRVGLRKEAQALANLKDDCDLLAAAWAAAWAAKAAADATRATADAADAAAATTTTAADAWAADAAAKAADDAWAAAATWAVADAAWFAADAARAAADEAKADADAARVAVDAAWAARAAAAAWAVADAARAVDAADAAARAAAALDVNAPQLRLYEFV
jgi:hypothetical protein